jgi:acyl-CoA thioesterase I
MPDASPPCPTHDDLVRFTYPLKHLTASLKSQRKIKIVAIGSSSTAGADNVIPYPCRLELALRQRYYGRMIDVLNRGIGGQEALDEYSRFGSDIVEEMPALVIWQVGTNAVFRDKDYNRADVAKAVVAGLNWLGSLPMDVVLMDLQYTQAMVGPDKLAMSEDMVSRIASAANDAKVNVFQRWALMKRWCLRDNILLPAMDDGGQLHTSDWATNCVTLALDGAIASAPPPPTA